MPAYVAKRVLSLIPTLLGVLTLVFFLLHVLPGDPTDFQLGESANAVDATRWRQAHGLADPLIVQYGRFLASLASGDLGTSLHSGEPVLGLVRSRLPATLLLAIAAVTAALLLAIPLGLLSAARAGSWIDHAARLLAVLAGALPNLWLGPLAILVFAIYLRWTPVAGSGSPTHLILPALTLGFGMSASLARLLRASLLDRLRDDFIRTAYAKGASRRRVLVVHALRNAILPLVTVTGTQVGHLLAGTLITETIFAWPGLGRLLVGSLQSRDYPVTQACVLVIAFLYVAVNLLTDLCYAAADPRVRLER